jgi:predicted type IV restriction endonuclease
VNESDTVTIVTDMLADIFGFDKYSEITSEQSIRGTFCDLAVTIDGTIRYLIEVKAVGLTLKNNHLRQAVNYGANQGIPWVVLTNGVQWQVYKIKFEKPIAHELVFEFDFLQLSPRKKSDHALLYLLCRSGIRQDAISDYHEKVQIVNRFVLAALIQSNPVVNVLRRELKRLAPDSKVEVEEVEALIPDVIKRDALDGDQAMIAARLVQRGAKRSLRRKRKNKEGTAVSVPEALPQV